VARCVKVIAPDSKLFQVLPCKKNKAMGAATKGFADPADLDNMSCRVAPGMEISFIIRLLSPEMKTDYSYDLMVVTEREKFIVPIRAVGCVSMIEFPDKLDFGMVPVKFKSEKPVMMRNIGEKTTKWQIKVPDGFQVNKKEGILEIG
jgi:hydrocephalus-inducing protein